MKAVKYVEMPEAPQIHAVETSDAIYINLCYCAASSDIQTSPSRCSPQ